MKEKHITTDSLEDKFNIIFTSPDPDLLLRLNEQIATVAQQLGTEPHLPTLPDRGFLESPLDPVNEGGLLKHLSETYAQNAVALQDKLTSVVLDESGEKMLNLPALFQSHGIDISLSSLPFHSACGDWSGQQRVFWVRESVGERILKAGESLKSIGVVLHLEDGFRPVGVQEGLFSRRVGMILNEHPEWIDEWEKVWKEARSKTAISPWMAGHKSGAAIDITLYSSDGKPLPLGNKYPDGGPKVAIDYPYVTQEEWATRQLFTATMEMSGLRLYPYENWHVSFGDLSAGIQAYSMTEITPNYHGIYGPIKGFDPTTGDVEPYPIEEYFEPFFTKEELLAQFQ